MPDDVADGEPEAVELDEVDDILVVWFVSRFWNPLYAVVAVGGRVDVSFAGVQIVEGGGTEVK